MLLKARTTEAVIVHEVRKAKHAVPRVASERAKTLAQRKVEREEQERERKRIRQEEEETLAAAAKAKKVREQRKKRNHDYKYRLREVAMGKENQPASGKKHKGEQSGVPVTSVPLSTLFETMQQLVPASALEPKPGRTKVAALPRFVLRPSVCGDVF